MRAVWAVWAVRAVRAAGTGARKTLLFMAVRAGEGLFMAGGSRAFGASGAPKNLKNEPRTLGEAEISRGMVRLD